MFLLGVAEAVCVPWCFALRHSVEGSPSLMSFASLGPSSPCASRLNGSVLMWSLLYTEAAFKNERVKSRGLLWLPEQTVILVMIILENFKTKRARERICLPFIKQLFISVLPES